jgi:hypothetical protein
MEAMDSLWADRENRHCAAPATGGKTRPGAVQAGLRTKAPGLLYLGRHLVLISRERRNAGRQGELTTSLGKLQFARETQG